MIPLLTSKSKVRKECPRREERQMLSDRWGWSAPVIGQFGRAYSCPNRELELRFHWKLDGLPA